MKHADPVARLRTFVVPLALLLLACACSTSGLAFVQDTRLEILSPEPRSTVELPVTIRWRIDGFRITGRDGRAAPDAGYFAVFVDTTPIPPGQTVAWVARDDRSCTSTPGCPDETYLADRGTHVTSETTFTLEQLPFLDAHAGREHHEVTIVLLDGTGHRIGESAWYVSFVYERPGG
jgi:hypothetical protein